MPREGLNGFAIETAITVLGRVSEEYDVSGGDRDAIGRVINVLEQIDEGQIGKTS